MVKARRALQTSLDQRVQALEKKVQSVSTDAKGAFCLGNTCFDASGDNLNVRHKIINSTVLQLNHSAYDFLKVFVPNATINQYVFVNRDMHFGAWDSAKFQPAGKLKAAVLCVNQNC